MAGGGLVMMLVFMIVRVTRRRRAALAIHPARITAAIVLFLPDRHAMFHFVDDETTGFEGLAAMRGTDSDPHGHIAQTQRADAMDAQGVFHGEATQGFGDDALAFLHREFLECLVFQTSDLLSLIVIPNPPLEADVAARGRVEAGSGGREVPRDVLDDVPPASKRASQNAVAETPAAPNEIHWAFRQSAIEWCGS